MGVDDGRGKPTCCISQAQGIRVIGTLSLVFGMFIVSLIAFREAYPPFVRSSKGVPLNGEDQQDLLFAGESENSQVNAFVIRCLLFVGGLSSLSSLWLLCQEGSGNAVKLWTGLHILGCLICISMFLKLLMLGRNEGSYSDMDYLMQVLLSFAGLDLCCMIFNCLVMTEFILHPSSPSDTGPTQMATMWRMNK